jgi:pimeloyl-[acyl-carrier protein] methyl ester esterase
MSAPLVLLHGWGMVPAVFDPLIAHLPGIDCLAPPLPGHAGAPTAPPTLDGWADALAARLPDGATVLGWSLGGQVAIRLAVRHPDKVARLVLMASTPRFLVGDDWHAGVAPADLDAFAADLLNDAPATLMRFLALQTRGAPGQTALLARLRDDLAAAPAHDAQALADGLELLRTNDLRAAWRTLTLPVLVVHGARDRLTPLPAGEWLAANAYHARGHWLPAAAHAPGVSHAVEVAAMVRAFIDG